MYIENTLIQECQENKRTAQEQLYKKLFPYLMGICYRYFLSKELSKEIVNTAMFKILTQIQNYDNKYPFKVWASKITIHCIIDELRKKQKINKNVEYIESYDANFDYSSEINPALSKMSANEILNLIEKLEPTEKAVFNLFAIDGYSHKEIAELLNISEGTSKWYLNQARKKLKNMLEYIHN
ncbi:MAG: RNA polymerase ECF-type sigma factor [Bacteroidia bacterium]|nr:MAG: RNA polymerase ECF-type sigma factor [Bacteroidia bacterium]